MFGKVFGSMFSGSLYGKGWGPLLVMSYAIANGVPDKKVGMQVDLNPKEMADKFGEDEKEVRKAIEFLCKPDADTTSPEQGGRRLVKIGAFAYQIVNGAKYRAIRDAEKRREQVRVAQARHRAKKRGLPLPGEALAMEAEARGEGMEAALDMMSREDEERGGGRDLTPSVARSGDCEDGVGVGGFGG